jgi:2-oxoglutarate ferredoxin oxidoreductase subunit beta
VALALGADASFVARSMDRDPAHLREMLKASQDHRGSSYLEVYQNCNVFNDGAFSKFTEKDSKALSSVFLEEGKPLLFGNGEFGIRLEGFRAEVVQIGDAYSPDDLMIHDPSDATKAYILSRMFDDEFPRPFGVFYRAERETYDEALNEQIKEAISMKGPGNLDELIRGRNTWKVE